MNKLTKNEKLDIINTKDNYSKALKLTKILFKDKVDKQGKPYIEHLIRVSHNVKNEQTKVAAILHDTLEDIENINAKDLKDLGFNDYIINLVKLVTKNDKTTYHEFITNIIESGNIEAIKIKYSDMQDNYNKERLDKLDNKQKEHLINKYKDEIIRLENYLKERGEI